jgi:CheY-like chemotaxis protein
VAESRNRVILIALRAAAILIIATGLNDVIAGAVPLYEPLYLYLGAVALVVLLDGVILGTLTAIAAIAFYALLFMRRADALSQAVLLPLGIAIVVVVVAGIVRALVRMRRRATPDVVPRVQAQVLLAPSTPSVLDQTEVLDAIAALREELRDRESTLRGALRMAEEENARLLRLADLERAERMHLETAARDQSSSLVARVTELESSARHGVETTHAENETLRQIADELRRTIDAHRDRAIRAEEMLSDVTSAHAEAERQLSERAAQAEARVVELEIALSTVTASRENDLGKAIEEREAARAEARGSSQRVHALEVELASSRARVGELEEELVDAVSAQGEAERKVHDRDAEFANVVEDREALRAAMRSLTQRVHDLDSESSAARNHASADLERKLQQRDAELAKVMDDRDALRAAMRSLTQRVHELDSELTTAHERVHELEEAAASTAAEFDQKLQTITTHLAHDHEADLGKAIEEREAARAEERAWVKRAQTLSDELSASREHAASVEEQLQVASAEARALLLRAHEAEEALNRASEGFDEKLNTIVAHLAQDHEADLGKALGDKEEARAEVRSLTMRLSTLQKRFDELRGRLSEIEKSRAPLLPNGATRPRVLIAHPDADLRMSARASLERAGYEILSAGDGLEALRTANAERPDVVIADAVMPKMDGRELCQLLKSQPKTAHIRVILLTRGNEDPSKGDLPPDGVLRKPVPLEMLKSTLASLLPASRHP